MIVAALAVGSIRHRPVLTFSASRAVMGASVLYSTIVRVELLQALVAVANDPVQLSPSVRRRYRLQHWGRFDTVRRSWLRDGVQLFDDFLREFTRVSEIELHHDILGRALEIMAAFQLKSNDAIHVASALAAGATELATTDADFLKVNGLEGLSVTVVGTVTR